MKRLNLNKKTQFKEEDAGEELFYSAEEAEGGGGEAGVPQEQAQWRVGSQVPKLLLLGHEMNWGNRICIE